MKVALIISTYNWPGALDLCLASVAQQSKIPDQVVIGDDGSGAETKSVIDKWRGKLNIVHEWQDDTGFRLARSRNIALRKVECDYVVCIDGDMVLHPEFIADHVAFAQCGTFVQGSRVLLNDEFSKQIMADAETWEWEVDRIRNGVLGNAKNLLRKKWLSSLIGLSKKASAKNTRTCNMAFWMDDLRAVNGFDNDYEGWGREDSDLTHRLVNYGLKRRKLKFSATGLHLYHPEEPRDSLLQNDVKLERVMTDSSYCRVKNGIEVE